VNVVITGGAGFLGRRLAQAILDRGELGVHGAPPKPVERVILLDQVELAPAALGDPRLRSVRADLTTVTAPELAGWPEIAGADVVFHLAAAVSGECEADFDLGIRVNLDGGRTLLEALRLAGGRPALVFASSLAVFGAWPGLPLPPVVTDETLPTPRSSYGIQKFILEQLVADYTRKGFINGRTVRLMTVSVRPGRPNGAASGFLSGIIREPLAGQEAVCPVAPELAVALSSPESSIEGLLAAAVTAEAEWGAPVAVNLPALHVTVGDMVAALAAVAGDATAGLIRWEPDEQVADIVSSWPARIDAARARRLGLTADPDFETVVRRYQQRYA
jgi:D-erythronate 2-dehydrogenase